MLDFRIDTFLAVCEHMNYTRAAEALNITQPAVSQHIRWLENLYQVRLFEYREKQLHLTPQGNLLKIAATTCKHDQLYLQQCLAQSTEQPQDLHFGVTPTVGMCLIPQPLARYHQKHPQAKISVQMDNTQTLCRRLDEGSIDFAIVEGFFHKSDYDFHVYQTEPYIAVCSAQYPLPEAAVCLNDLRACTLLVREQGSGNREILQRTLSQQNLLLEDFACVMELGDMNLLKTMLLKHCGIAFLYQVNVEEELQQGILHKIPLRDLDESHDIYFIWRKNSIFAARYDALFQELLP